jgi:HEPN domain-containing protein
MKGDFSMPHDPIKIEEVKAWLAKSRIDLKAAEHDRTADPPLTADIVFHAQQLVEKVLKAYLCWHDQPFRKTHNLIEIGEQCAKLDNTLEPILRRVAPLTEYAWKFRYPGDPEEPDIVEADQALNLAREVYEHILLRLPEEAKP